MTKRTTRRLGAVAGVMALIGAVLYSAAFVGAAVHLDAPAVAVDGRTDINDLYAFQSPTDPDDTVIIMTVNPGAGVISGTTFDPKAAYELHVDDNGDAVADHTITVDFKVVNPKGQRYKVQLDGETVGQGLVGSTTPLPKVGGQLTAGLFDDPFFFDLVGFRNGFAFTGSDFFAGLNVSAIVLEIPSAVLSDSPDIGIWATTRSNDGAQIDRMGRPAINTVLIPSARKDEFNAGDPANDVVAFGADVQATIEALSGGDSAFAAAVTAVLLPDILTVDTSDPAGFLNGRGLPNDVIDAELDLLTKGAVTGDGVDANDVAFRGQFPYLAPAH